MSILVVDPPAVRARSGQPPAAWQVELRDAIRDPRALCQALDLPPKLADEAAAASFPVVVPAAYLSRIERGNPGDPLLRQVLPLFEETVTAGGFTSDPVGDGSARQTPGLLQKYAGRALLIVTGACAIHCRYCFRREYPYEEVGSESWAQAMDVLAADESIEEVILSGGDPLTLADGRLGRLIERLAAIAHLNRLRVHTRLPVVIPSRVTDDLIGCLRGCRLRPVMVLHANHARELDAAVAGAVERLRRADVMLLNQAVLLRGVNDSVEAQCDLSKRLIEIGVVPYYLHQLDRVSGAAHFEAPVVEGLAIVEELRRRLPGYAVPRYVQEDQGAESKTILF